LFVSGVVRGFEGALAADLASARELFEVGAVFSGWLAELGMIPRRLV
jgi:hypothetical protein